MKFSEIISRVAEELGLDATADATKIKAWINESYRFISGLRNWPWLLKNGIIQTTADITTGTASVNAGGTTVTLSAGPAASVATDYMIQFSDDSDNWYTITAHTAGATEATITPAFVGTANYDAGSYIIRRVFYSLASDADKIINMREAINDVMLSYVDPREFDRTIPDPTATAAVPYVYSLLGFDSSRQWRAYFYPIPSAVNNIAYRYYLKITDLSGNDDVPLMPETWHQAIVFVALAMYGHPYIDDSRMQMAEMRSRAMLSEMIKQISPMPDKFPIMQPWDQRSTRVWGPQFPPEFPRTWR
jgi:hypothetical protein